MNLPFHTEETIAAIATAISAGKGGIAVIRISGNSALAVAKNIVHIPGTKQWESHHVLYGHVQDKETREIIDEVLVFFMKAPRSFTGEDVVEIHCHGGLVAVQRVLQIVLQSPLARRALPGEFSERAVLNGRLDLTQAEAISDLISARSEKAAKLAVVGISGEINKKISHLREQLLDQLSELEARVDFEDELPPLDPQKLLNEIHKVENQLQVLIDDSKSTSFVRNGIKAVLVGLPNVGKSSLLNRLSKSEKAIVTDVPGTTRDLVEIGIVLKDVPITLVDTAGIHSSKDAVEKIGIERSHQAIKDADVIVLIFDLSRGWSQDDQNLLDQIPLEIPKIIVGNKSDIAAPLQSVKPNIRFSALTGDGEEQLITKILTACGTSNIEELRISLNERQLDLAILAKSALARTQDLAFQDLPWDFWTIDLREAIHKLGELSGEEITESILDRIFSRFCIGK
ncbi:tRNA uridine-5-carboxymethylaminomethyl(34) synthesis GTPase MnmE [Prochlorococcus sp. MIT 1223]|uniref:tRNA uridine-5-carboxymethylaminomethyl(34) synthesis GTPase MnmE n=1 Tax=Prochlorococcus sp. MIT 1223 TaxID=3096217 RepID=UPI002A74880D|nr:tRNA uridine-5-carboxymethylaminomethyl(34) synthesis GTPase MnmE [Prochlorococcus sp. MIT 1223]